MSSTKDSLDKFRKSVALEHVLFWDKPELDLETSVRRYKTNYWDVIHGDALPAGLALCMFDFGVVSGTKVAIQGLQTVLMANGQKVEGGADGVFGKATIEALANLVDNPKQTLDLLKWYTAYRNMFHFENPSHKGTVADNQRRAADTLVKATMQTLLEM